jgi:hypothetical protein
MLGEHGYPIYYRKSRFQPPAEFKWIEVLGERISFQDHVTWAGGLYDPSTKVIWRGVSSK